MSQAWERALAATSLSADDIGKLIVTGTHGRAVARNAKRLGVRDEAMVDDLSGSVGNTGTAHPLLVLTSVLEQAHRQDHRRDDPRRRRRGHRAAHHRRHRRRCTGDVDCRPDRLGHHGLLWKILSWRGMVSVEPPNRPLRTARPHRRPSRDDWKFGFVGSRDRNSGMITCRLPGSRRKAVPSTTWNPCRWPTRSARS